MSMQKVTIPFDEAVKAHPRPRRRDVVEMLDWVARELYAIGYELRADKFPLARRLMTVLRIELKAAHASELGVAYVTHMIDDFNLAERRFDWSGIKKVLLRAADVAAYRAGWDSDRRSRRGGNE